MKTMFDIIKKQNGEHFAKAIRAYDNGIFDIPDLDKIVKYAGREVEPLMNYLVSLKNVKIEEHAVHQHPFDLLSRAGYTAYYADTLEKQNWPKQFYAPREELCTFRDPNRYINYHIVVAIKKNVQDIKRENFPHPKREDEYGTSVLQIQMLKSGGFISIKNRYNHTVPNPDNTFNSNPDNIIPGLSDALMHYYHVDFSSQKVHLPENYVLMDNQIVNYNYEVNNVYFGENYYVKNGEIHEINKQKELMLDYFILNLQDKSIKNPHGEEDGFMTALQEEIKDKKLQITVNEQGNKCLQADGKTILELNNGKIKSLHFDNVKKIDHNFLQYNKELSEISMSQVTNIGDNFLLGNEELSDVSFPNVKYIGTYFLSGNFYLENISLPQVQLIGNFFLKNNTALKELSLPKITTIGDYFLLDNEELSDVSFPNVKHIGNYFLSGNFYLENISLPQVQLIGDSFLESNSYLKKLSLPKTTKIGDNFLLRNKQLEKIFLPEVREIGNKALPNNKALTRISLPQATTIGFDFLCYNEGISNVSLPQVTNISSGFLRNNQNLTEISLPEVRGIDSSFLACNKQLNKISLPEVRNIGDYFLYDNINLSQLLLPKAIHIGRNFLKDNKKLKVFYGPHLLYYECEAGLNAHRHKTALLQNLDKEPLENPKKLTLLQQIKSYFSR